MVADENISGEGPQSAGETPGFSMSELGENRFDNNCAQLRGGAIVEPALEQLCELSIPNGTTQEVLLKRYHTLTRRADGVDPRTRKVMFKSFARILGPWLPRKKSSSILDIGCGEGVFLAFLSELGYGNLSGFDLSPENVQICHRRGLAFVQQHDALRLDEFQRTTEYDMVYCFDLLEHLSKERAVRFLHNVYLRIAKGGCAVFQTPNMGSILALFHRYHDLTHEYGVTESSAVTLLMTAGFREDCIEVRPSWNATTWLGYLRELYLRGLHILVWMAEGSSRPRIPTKNLLIRVTK